MTTAESNAGLIKLQRTTIALLVWALIVAALLCRLENSKVRAARAAEAAAVHDRLAQNATVESAQRLLREKDARLRRYEQRFGPLETRVSSGAIPGADR